MKIKKAKWIRRSHLFSGDEYQCSSCRKRTDKPRGTCPFCGAVMKGMEYDPVWVDEMDEFDSMFED